MTTCPYCQNLSSYYFTIVSRNFYRCLTCDLIHQNLENSYNETVATYRENYFDRHSADETEGQRDRLYDHILKLIARNSEIHGVRRLLDVGTGCGFFLVAAKRSQWATKGVEPSIQSVEVARRHNNLDVLHGTLAEFDENGQFEVITFINVLDHSAMPWLEIDRARKLLCPGGLIYIRFPNGLLHSLLYRIAKRCGLSTSLRKFLVFHSYSFTPMYIKKLLDDKGFVRVTVLNSLPSDGDPHNLFRNPTLAFYIKRLLYLLATAARSLSTSHILLGTSLEVIAVKRTAQHLAPPIGTPSTN